LNDLSSTQGKEGVRDPIRGEVVITVGVIPKKKRRKRADLIQRV
jgi:hypothetical protein